MSKPVFTLVKLKLDWATYRQSQIVFLRGWLADSLIEKGIAVKVNVA